MMLGGCDLAGEAEPEAAEVVQAEAEPPGAEAEPGAQSPEPMILGRTGIAGVVEQTIAQTRASEPSRAPSESRPVEAPEPPPIADLGRPAEPEGSRAFVPYDGGRGTVASAPLTLARPSVRPRPKPRVRPTPRVQPVDEPCDPALVAVDPPDREWQCPACGRG